MPAAWKRVSSFSGSSASCVGRRQSWVGKGDRRLRATKGASKPPDPAAETSALRRSGPCPAGPGTGPRGRARQASRRCFLRPVYARVGHLPTQGTEAPRKKAQLLDLPTPESEKDDSVKPRSILAKHCEKMLLTVVKSPSSTKIRSETEFPSPALSPALKRFLSEGQSVDAPGTTVFIEYDAPNSYGVMLPGKITCDYTNPQFVQNDLAFVPRMIMLDSNPIDPLRAKLMGIQGHGDVGRYDRIQQGT